MEDRDISSESEDVGELEDLSGTDATPAAHRKIFRPSLRDKKRKIPDDGNSREMRNQAERNRRSKINNLIGQLYYQLPVDHPPEKKLDKISILRLSVAFLRAHRVLSMKIPSHVKPSPLERFDFTDILLKDLDAILMVVSAGKIVLISDTVEQILGYSKTLLLGSPLLDYACPDDHEELLQRLTPDEVPEDCHCIRDGSDDEDLALVPASAQQDQWTTQKRSFFCKLKRRTGPHKTNTPHYEVVHFDGDLHVPPRSYTNSNRQGESSSCCGSSSGSSTGSGPTTDTQDPIFVAIVRPYREHSLDHRTLLESSKEEYITRHTMDGRIIFCDQRISLVSGYLPHEVVGLSAFNYMHRADVQWTIVALKQMFTKGEEYGSSCYRLKTKNNEFIYLKTFGYLEKDEETNTVDSFICMNILVPEKEGRIALKEMKTRFSPQFQLMDSPHRNAISGVTIEEVTDQAEPSAPVTETDLEEQISYLLTCVPEQSEPMSPCSTGGQAPPTPECALVTYVSKNLPRASTHAAQAGITNVPKLGAGIGGQSPRTPQSPTGSLRSEPPAPRPQMMEVGPARPSVVCGPRSSVVSSTIRVSPLPSPTTPEAVRTSVISGLKRSHDATPSRDGPRGEESPKKKCSRTRSRIESDPKEPASRLGFTPTQTAIPRVTAVDEICSPDPRTSPAVPESHAQLPGYRNGGWQQPDGMPFPDEVLISESTFSTDPFLGTADFVTFPGSDDPCQLQLPMDPDLMSFNPDDSAPQVISRQHYHHLGTSLLAEGRCISNTSQGLQQVPIDGRVENLDGGVVQLVVEHTRPERTFQELQRDTHNIPNYPMGAQ